jgi:hypothetical protein
MQFLAVLRRRIEAFSHEEFAARLDAEAQRVAQLYAEGTIRVAWSRGDVPGAVLVLEATDQAAAERALATLPFVESTLAEVHMVAELRPYRGFVPQ